MRLRAQPERVFTQRCDAYTQPVAQAGIDGLRERAEVLLGLQERGFRAATAATARFRFVDDRFEVALQRSGVGARDQSSAGASAGDDEQRCAGS